MRTLPFLYLPDAVTIILLILVFTELRKVAICHIRQELLMIRKEMIAFRLNHEPDQADEGYLAFRDLLDSSIRFAPRLSPGRLLFAHRLQKRMREHGLPWPVPDPVRTAGLCIDRIPDKSGRDKLRRLQTEMNLALGAFFLFGSISGWANVLLLVPKMVRRSLAHHPGNRIDAFFDMTERVLSLAGRRAQELGLAGRI
jgi:hypothetical protein